MLKEILLEMSQNPKVATAIGVASGGTAKIAEWGGMIDSVLAGVMVVLGMAAPISVVVINLSSHKFKEREHGAQIRIYEKDIEIKDLQIILLKKQAQSPDAQNKAPQ